MDASGIYGFGGDIRALIFAAILFIGFLFAKSRQTEKKDIIYEKVQEKPAVVDLSAIPEYSGCLYVELNGNKPFLTVRFRNLFHMNTTARWMNDKGFGFIKPEDGGRDIFAQPIDIKVHENA